MVDLSTGPADSCEHAPKDMQEAKRWTNVSARNYPCSLDSFSLCTIYLEQMRCIMLLLPSSSSPSTVTSRSSSCCMLLVFEQSSTRTTYRLVYGQTQLLGFHSHLSRSAETRACAVIFLDFLWIFRTF